MLRNRALKIVGYVLCVIASIPFVYGAEWLNATLSGAGESSVAYSVVLASNSTVRPATGTTQSIADVQQEFWSWAWNSTWYGDDSVVLLTPQGNGVWDAEAWGRTLAGVEFLVGTGQFIQSAWYDIGSDSGTEVDSGSGNVFDIDVVASTVSGTFISETGSSRSMCAQIARSEVVGITAPALSTDTYALSPSDINISLSDASALAYELYKVATGAGGGLGILGSATEMSPSPSFEDATGGDVQAMAGAGGFCGGGGGFSPCEVGNDSCECLCASEYASNKRNCDNDRLSAWNGRRCCGLLWRM